MYKALNANKVATEQVLPILKGTHFTVLLGPQGASAISHETDIAPPSEEIARRVRQSVDGIDQLLTGFFQTWSNFMFEPLLPEPDDEYRLQDLGENYRLSFAEKATTVTMTMSHELAIEEVKVTSPELEATLHPQWSPSSDGLLLAGYQASYKIGTGEPGQLSVKVEYGEVERLSLPSTVDATVPGGPTGSVTIRLVFLNYQVKKR